MIARLHRIGKRFRSSVRSGWILARVLFVALRGLYKSWWVRDRTADITLRRSSRAAYRQLWAKLENVYWKSRATNNGGLEAAALLQDADAFLTGHLRYFRASEHASLAHYIGALRRLENTTDTVSDTLVSTRSIGDGRTSMNATRQRVAQATNDLRNQMLQKLRHTLREP